MKRKIYEKLLDWKKNSASKCALLIEGARRVGKSYVVQEFAKNEYEHSLIIDFASAKPRISEYSRNICPTCYLETGSLISDCEVQGLKQT